MTNAYQSRRLGMTGDKETGQTVNKRIYKEIPIKLRDGAQKRFVMESEFVLKEIMGEFVLIPTGSRIMTASGVISVSESAAYLLRNMGEGKTSSELCALLLEEYDVDEETAARDVDEMLYNMWWQGIIKMQ